MKIWIRGSSPRSGSRNSWTPIKNVNGASRLSKFWNFFGAIQKISCRDWWQWTKHGYITMNRRQSNNQWGEGIAAQLAPKNSECKNPLKKFSPRFFGIKTASSSLIIQTINAEFYSSLLVQLKDILNEKRRGKITKVVLFLHDNTPAYGALATQKKLAYLASNVLITHPILRIWPHRNSTCSLDWKNNWKFAIFRPTRILLLPRRPGWTDNLLIFFLSDLQS